jgi:hypothetical protein
MMQHMQSEMMYKDLSKNTQSHPIVQNGIQKTLQVGQLHFD